MDVLRGGKSPGPLRFAVEAQSRWFQAISWERRPWCVSVCRAGVCWCAELVCGLSHHLKALTGFPYVTSTPRCAVTTGPVSKGTVRSIQRLRLSRIVCVLPVPFGEFPPLWRETFECLLTISDKENFIDKLPGERNKFFVCFGRSWCAL